MPMVAGTHFERPMARVAKQPHAELSARSAAAILYFFPQPAVYAISKRVFCHVMHYPQLKRSVRRTACASSLLKKHPPQLH